MMSGRAGVLALGLSLLFCSAAFAAPGAFSQHISGSYRNLAFRATDTAGKALNSDLNRLRLQLDGGFSSLSWHLAYDQELLYGELVSSPDFAPVAKLPEPTWLDAEHTIARGARLDWRHRLYRTWLRYEGAHADVVIGRQRIAWGTARIWNPTDRFNPVEPTALEPSEKTGVDALVATWRYSDFGALQLVAAPGRASHRVSRKAALRWRDTFGEADVSLTLGRMGVERVLGGDLAANIMQGTFRLEAMRAWPGRAGGYTQVAIGYDYTLTGPLFPAGLYLLVEYFHNGRPGDAPALVPLDRLYARARHQAGFSIGYDISPLWRITGTFIWDASGGSRFFLPRLSWSASDNVDISAFALLFGGNRTSEFGRRGNTAALQADVYF